MIFRKPHCLNKVVRIVLVKEICYINRSDRGGIKMGKYISYIREKKLAKVTLALLCAVLLLGIYCFWNAFLYLPAKIFAAALIGFIAVIIILWITHYKLPKLSVCLEVVMVILLITASMAVNKVNTFTEKVTVTKK